MSNPQFSLGLLIIGRNYKFGNYSMIFRNIAVLAYIITENSGVCNIKDKVSITDQKGNKDLPAIATTMKQVMNSVVNIALQMFPAFSAD